MIILFDIDNTLINTHDFKVKFAKNISIRCNIDLETFHNFEKKYIQQINGSNNINISEYTVAIANEFNCPVKKIEENYINDKKIYQEVVFEGVEQLLIQLKEKHTLGIYSEGSQILQMLKLNNSDLSSYFSLEHIYIFRNKLDDENIAKLPTESIIIDDKKEVIAYLKKSGFQAVHFTNYSDLKSIVNQLYLYLPNSYSQH